MVVTGISVLLVAFIIYGIMRLVDKYCQTEVDEEYIARMMERFEDDQEDVRNNAKTIFRNMTKEERRSVLDQVLYKQVSFLRVWESAPACN